MKRILSVLLIIFLLCPLKIYASILDEVPPYVYVDGINENEYNIIKTIKEKEVVIELENKKTKVKYSWSFDKDKIGNKIELNFNIDFNEIENYSIEEQTLDIDKMYINFSHTGSLPSKAKIKVDVSKKFKNNENLYLYYYNETTKKLEFNSDNIIVTDGYAEFEIDHCSKYILTNAIVNDAVNNPKGLSYIILGLVIAVIGLVAYTVFKK